MFFRNDNNVQSEWSSEYIFGISSDITPYITPDITPANINICQGVQKFSIRGQQKFCYI